MADDLYRKALEESTHRRCLERIRFWGNVYVACVIGAGLALPVDGLLAVVAVGGLLYLAWGHRQ